MPRLFLSGAVMREALTSKKVSPAVRQTHPAAIDEFKNSYNVEFLGLAADHSEADLHGAPLGNLGRFLTELGRDFCFVGSQYPIQVGNQDFAIDIVFFHCGLQCLVAFELKVDKFKPADLGQLSFYVEALDRDVKKPHVRSVSSLTLLEMSHPASGNSCGRCPRCCTRDCLQPHRSATQSRMPRAKRPKSSKVRLAPKAAARPVTTALGKRTPSVVLAALLHERKRLLKQIAKKQTEFEREREELRVVGQSLFERLGPLMQERLTLIKEIEGRFRELLASGRLSKSARKKVANVYEALCEDGDFESLEAAAEGNEASEPDYDFDFDPADTPRGNGAHERVDTAEHSGGRPGNDSLKALFRRLAVALHPDLVQEVVEQKRRTEVMKEVTRAYEAGDLARLLELEQAWLSGGAVESSECDENAEIAKLEKIVCELQAQQQELTASLRELRHSSPLTDFFGERRVSLNVRRQQVDELIERATFELQPFREIRNHVQAFAEKRISLAEFCRGPASMRVENIPDDLLDFVFRETGVDLSSAVSSNTRAGRRKRPPYTIEFDDIPF